MSATSLMHDGPRRPGSGLDRLPSLFPNVLGCQGSALPTAQRLKPLTAQTVRKTEQASDHGRRRSRQPRSARTILAVIDIEMTSFVSFPARIRPHESAKTHKSFTVPRVLTGAQASAGPIW